MASPYISLQDLASLTNSTVVGDPSYLICDVADLETAGAEDISFLNKLPFGQSSRYEKMMSQSKAGAIFVHPDVQRVEGRNYLLNEDPSRAFQHILEKLKKESQELSGFDGVHPTAVVHSSAKLGKDITLGPYSVIDKGCIIGDGSHIGAHCYLGPFTEVGLNCIFHPHVMVREGCKIGNRVILQPGAIIGSDGFGYTTDKKGCHTKLNQVGNVILEDDVEIGANTTIDRSRFKSTKIGRGSKIDNLVQIGHGVQIGEDNLIVAQTGIAGSTKTGRCVVLAGQVGVTGHIEICSGVIVTARAGVDKSLTEPGKYGGVPARPLRQHNETQVYVQNIKKWVDEVKTLKLKVDSLK